MAEWYIVVVYDDGVYLRRILRTLKRHGSIKAVALLVALDNKAVLRGIKNISKNVAIVKGYLPLPAP